MSDADQPPPQPPPQPQQIPVLVDVPAELETGVYANLLAVWHSAYDFTLDFAVVGRTTEQDGQLVVKAPVVARVKVPVSVIFSIAQAIAQNVDQYERVYGPITPRANEGPLYPPAAGA